MAPSSKTFTYGVSLRREAGRQAQVVRGEQGRHRGRAALATSPVATRALEPRAPLPRRALSSCMMLSFLAHADHADIDVEEYTSAIEGTIRRRADDSRYAFTAIQVRPRVVVGRGQLEAARGLLAKAERDCFISASTSAEISVEWEIAELAAPPARLAP